MNVREILAQWIKEHGFDGLYANGDCGCEVSDLMPCMESPEHCEPGYKRPCPPDCGDHDWHIGPKKKDGT